MLIYYTLFPGNLFKDNIGIYTLALASLTGICVPIVFSAIGEVLPCVFSLLNAVDKRCIKEAGNVGFKEYATVTWVIGKLLHLETYCLGIVAGCIICFYAFFMCARCITIYIKDIHRYGFLFLTVF